MNPKTLPAYTKDMTTHPDPDTRVEFLEKGSDFYHLGRWHKVAKVQTHRAKGQETEWRYVFTEEGRVFFMPMRLLVAMTP